MQKNKESNIYYTQDKLGNITSMVINQEWDWPKCNLCEQFIFDGSKVEGEYKTCNQALKNINPARK